MNVKRIAIAVLIFCLTVTSCAGVTPQVFAAAAAGQENAVQEDVSDTTTEEDVQDDLVTDEEEAGEPEEPETVINAWDENGFYHGEDGQIVINKILLIDGLMYKFDGTGTAVKYTGTKSINGKTYYYKNGLKYTGLRTINGKTYYYKNGLKHTGLRAINGKSYYYKNGLKYTGTRTIKGKTYYYKKGLKYTGTRKISGKYYYYKNGLKHTGLRALNGKSYYYSNGRKVTKYKSQIKKAGNGKFYYFKKDASVYTGTGWKRIDGKRYYFKKGVAYTGWHYIGGYKYYFHKKTASLCQDLIGCQGDKWKKKDLMVKVNRKKNIVTIYAKDGNNGYTIPVKALTCSVGKAETPTVTGTFTMTAGSGKTYRWHVLGGPAIGTDYCYGQYCVRIYKSWMFHSVTYAEKDKYTLHTSAYNGLGQAASHGCIRLRVIDAKLLYDIVNYRDTKVKIYDSDWAGPFDKPVYKKIPSTQKYDPTDPSI